MWHATAHVAEQNASPVLYCNGYSAERLQLHEIEQSHHIKEVELGQVNSGLHQLQR